MYLVVLFNKQHTIKKNTEKDTHTPKQTKEKRKKKPSKQMYCTKGLQQTKYNLFILNFSGTK